MPVATINPEEYERFDLKSAPPDGYVMLRPLPYGMKLTRRDNASKMMMKAEAPKGGRGAVQQQTIELETLSEWATQYDFAYCVGEHNLTKTDGTNIDFTNPLEFKMLNPRIGSEIERYINDLNEEEGEETLEDFLMRSSTSSEDGETPSSTDLLERPLVENKDT